MTSPSCLGPGPELPIQQRRGAANWLGRNPSRATAVPAKGCAEKSKRRQTDSLLALAVPPARQSARGQPQPTHRSNLSLATHLPSPVLGHCHHRVTATTLSPPRASADELMLICSLHGGEGLDGRKKS